MSDASGRIHLHQHIIFRHRLWLDEDWAKATPEMLLKEDKVLEEDLFVQARSKISGEFLPKGKEDVDDGDDILSVRKVIQVLEEGIEREVWNDKGNSRIMDLLSQNRPFQGETSSHENVSFLTPHHTPR